MDTGRGEAHRSQAWNGIPCLDTSPGKALDEWTRDWTINTDTRKLSEERLDAILDTPRDPTFLECNQGLLLHTPSGPAINTDCFGKRPTRRYATRMANWIGNQYLCIIHPLHGWNHGPGLRPATSPTTKAAKYMSTGLHLIPLPQLVTGSSTPTPVSLPKVLANARYGSNIKAGLSNYTAVTGQGYGPNGPQVLR